MEFTIQESPSFTAVGLKVRHKSGGDPQGSNNIPQLWEAFVPRMGEILHPAGSHKSYGVMGNYDPTTNEFDYLAGVPMTSATDIPLGMESWEVPAQTYAVFPCNLKNVGETFQDIYQKWLPEADYIRTAGPEFELYDENFNPPAGKIDFTLWIPVQPK